MQQLHYLRVVICIIIRMFKPSKWSILCIIVIKVKFHAIGQVIALDIVCISGKLPWRLHEVVEIFVSVGMMFNNVNTVTFMGIFKRFSIKYVDPRSSNFMWIKCIFDLRSKFACLIWTSSQLNLIIKSICLL